MPTLKNVTLAVSLALSSMAYGAVAEKPSTLADQQSVAVTIYNENLALVKDVRQVALEEGLAIVEALLQGATPPIRSGASP